MKTLPKIREIAKDLVHDYTFSIPLSRKDTIDQAKAAKENGFDAVFALGGDGTVSDVIEGIRGQDIYGGVLPCGRGNDFVRNISGDLDTIKNIKALDNYTIKEIDVPTLNGYTFVNVAGVGFDAEVIRNLGTTNCRISGTFCYYWTVIRTILGYKAEELSITIDGKKYDGRFLLVAAANGPNFGGGMKIAPDADMNDGLLDICLVENVSKMKFFNVFPKVYKGKHTTIKEITMLRAKDMVITSKGNPAIQGDGDLGNPLPAHITIGDVKVKLVVGI